MPSDVPPPAEPPSADRNVGPTRERLAEQVAAVLRDDPELELEVRRELAAHLEDAAAAHAAAGREADESAALAAREFGRPEEVAEALLAANRRRMRRRGLVRLALRGLLLPAALGLALYATADALGRVRALNPYADAHYLGDEDRAVEAALRSAWPDPDKFREQRLLLLGDPSRKNYAERWRALWEAHPESRVYYANYVLNLQVGIFGPLRGEEPPPPERRRFLEAEFRRGQALDPKNALYDYLLAALHYGEAAGLGFRDPEAVVRARYREWKRTRGGPPPSRPPAGAELGEFVADRALLEQAGAELLAGTRKPRLSLYTPELLAERLAALPEAQSYREHVLRYFVGVTTIFRYPFFIAVLLRLSTRHAELLLGEGRAAEAAPLLEAWRPTAVQVVRGAETTLDVQGTADCAGVGLEAARLYETALNEPERAAELRRLVKRARYQDFDFTDPEAKSRWDVLRDRRIQKEKHGSQFLFFYSTGMNYLDEDVFPTAAELAPGRQVEQLLVDQAGLAGLLVLLLAGSFAALLVVLRWRWLPGASAAPLLLLPRAGEAARILGLGVLLPLGAFYLYTRWSGLAGREYGVAYLGWRFGLEWLLLAATILRLLLPRAARATARRCRELDLAVPESKPNRWWRALDVTLIVFWAGALLLRWPTAAEIAFPAAILILVLPALGAVGAELAEQRRRRAAALGPAARPRRRRWLPGLVGGFLAAGLIFLAILWLWLYYFAPGPPFLMTSAEAWEHERQERIRLIVSFLLLSLFAVPAGLLAARAVMLLIGVLRDRAHGLYYGTLARSLLPFLAAAALLLALGGRAYLVRSEAALVRDGRLVETTLVVEDGLAAENRPQLLQTQRLRRKLLELLEAPAANPERMKD